MSQRDLLIKRNNIARLLEPHSKRERNVVRINVGNTLRHEAAKFFLIWELLKEGKEVVTEAIFYNRKGRADVLDLDSGTAYEVMQSEQEADLEYKRSRYPPEVYVTGFDADYFVKKLLKELKKND